MQRRPARTDLDLMPPAARAEYDRGMGKQRSARKRAQDSRIGRPDGRTLDAALASAICYLVQHHLDLTTVYVTRLAVAYCVGHGCCRIQSRQEVRRHMERRALTFIEATIHRQVHGLPDLWVDRQRASEEARLAALSAGIRVLPIQPQAVVIEPASDLPAPFVMPADGLLPVLANA